MATLDWIGKKAVLNYHRTVPFHLLRSNEDFSVGDPGSGNLLVQGDNLLALKALLPYYAGGVKCIYIDPPYNTGEEHWIYNDAVNSPEMRRWLGQTVGKEADDLSRHDKWLCMMYPRLQLLREFLRTDGMIYVSIDDNEVATLRLLMDEVFGPTNFLGTLVWKRRSPSGMRSTPLSVDHEYILAYGRDASRTVLHGLVKGPEAYPYQDSRGRFTSTDLTIGMTRYERPNQFYPITNPRTGMTYQGNPERVWRFEPETMKKVIADDLVIWPDEAEGNLTRPRFKTYYNPEKPKPLSSWIETKSTDSKQIAADEVEFDLAILTSGLNQEGAKQLQALFGERAFAYPKPMSLLQALIQASTRGDDLILDSFAGSGTTGHAVLQVNQADQGQRRFILVEMEAEICQNITAERLQKTIQGYQPSKGAAIPGVGGGFTYSTLGTSMFDEYGRIRSEVSFDELASHVYFTETGEPMASAQPESPLIGVTNGTAVYLLYNGILGNHAVGENLLTPEVLQALPPHDGPKVIFGDGCTLSAARQRQEGIVFKQIPYQVKVG